MSTKEDYMQKVQAELELAQAKLAELKAKAKIVTADTRIQFAEQVDELEKRSDAAKAQLKELGGASEQAWERLKGGMESARDAFSAAVRDAYNKFKD